MLESWRGTADRRQETGGLQTSPKRETCKHNPNMCHKRLILLVLKTGGSTSSSYVSTWETVKLNSQMQQPPK
jgi:hypothetical protein